MIYFVNNTGLETTAQGTSRNTTAKVPLINFGFSIPFRRDAVYDSFTMKGTENDNYINSIKINSGDTYDSGEQTITAKEIKVEDTPRENYLMTTSYDYSESGSTILNAGFTGTLDAGDLGGSGESIVYFQVLRYGPEDNYAVPVEVARIIFNDAEDAIMQEKDHNISSMAPYFYKIRAVTENGNYGSTTTIRHLALNSYEYDWIICDAQTRISIINANISSVTNTRKDGVVETIGAQYPVVNRYTNTNYRTFSVNGTLATAADFNHDILDKVFTEYTSELTDNEISQINVLVRQKLGRYQHDVTSNGYKLRSMNNMMVDPYLERKYREKIIGLLADGKPKILKSPTLGMMIGKFTNINLVPKTQLNGYVADFTATFTEISDITEDSLRNFIDLKEDEIEERIFQIKQEAEDSGGAQVEDE